MRVALEATDALNLKRTGTGVYVWNLSRQMLQHCGPMELTLLGRRGTGSPPAGIHGSAVCLLSGPRSRTLWSQLRIPLHLARARYDLVHFFDHKLPRALFGRSVVTIHDTAFLRFPEMFMVSHRKRLEWFTRDAVRRADHIIAVSASTRDDLSGYYGTPLTRMTVIAHGVDTATYHPAVPPLHRDHPFLLSVGALQPRKNYGMLMRAFRAASARLTQRVDLVIVGQRGWMWKEIEREAARGPHSERIHLVGYVPDDLLPSYYTGALACLLPSLYEGFGIPALEAMACGTPVVASNASSMPEVIGAAGQLLDPTDEAAWTNAITVLVENGARRRAMGRSGLTRVEGFSWERAAMHTLDLYRLLLAR